VVKGLRFDRENVHHRNPAGRCTGTETKFRVTVAADESNSKMAHISPPNLTWDVG
jgi:hypothetical protein